MTAPGLTSGQYARLEPHLDAALDLAPQARDAFVAALAIDDADRAVLRAWLAIDTRDHPLDREPVALAQSLHEGDGAESVGAVIGGYRLLALIGEGGMATVWRARRVDGELARDVALKCLRTGFGTPERRERFLREQRILARLEHPYIARLYDAGVAGNGVPYIAMELVDGLPITEHARVHDLDLRQRLALFRKVVEAVAHAHAKLVVHRDLKPANILVAADGTPRLLDFGIAKPLDDDDTRTRTMFRALTPEYAAPEQFTGDSAGTAIDVYGLGATLYELLARRRPRRARREVVALVDGDRSVAAMVAAPSLAVTEAPDATAAHAPSEAVRLRLRAQLRGELDTLVLTAMHPEPERRYRSATALDDDLARYLDGLPLRAQPDSRGYRLRKFVQRHAWALALAGIAVVVLCGTTAIAVNRAIAADRAAARAAAVQEFLLGVFEAAQADPRGNAVLTTREMVDRAAARFDAERHDGAASEPALTLAIGRVYAKLGLTERAIDLLGRAVAGFEAERGESRELAVARQSHAVALVDGLRFAEAEQASRAALAWFDAHGAGVGTRAEALDGLFQAVYYQARYDEADRVARQALALLADAPDASSHARVVAHLDQAVALRGLARFDDAIVAARRAVAIAREPPVDQSDLARALSTQGSLQRRAGDCAGAVVTLREATTIDRANDRTGRASRFHNLARALTCARDYAAARGAAADALAAQIQALGPHHPELGQYREALALAMLGLGDLEGAEREMRAALVAFGRGYPPKSLNVRRKQQMLGLVLLARGTLDEAAQLFTASMPAGDGTDEPATEIEARCVAHVGLGRIALARGDLVAARAHLAAADAAARRHVLLEVDTRAALDEFRAALAARDAATP